MTDAPFKLPVRAEPHGFVVDANGDVICATSDDGPFAAFIVRAINAMGADDAKVERVARALWEAYPVALPAWEHMPETEDETCIGRHTLRDLARAAIAASEGGEAT